MSRALIDYFCHYDESLKHHLVCAPFFFAKVRGEIVPNKGDGCWEIPGSVQRSMSWKAKFHAEGRGAFEDHSGDLYSLFDCPWCGGELEPVAVERPSFPRNDAGGGQ